MKKDKCPKCNKKCSVLRDSRGIKAISCKKCGYFWSRDKKAQFISW